MKRDNKSTKTDKKLTLDRQTIRELKPTDLSEGAGAALAGRLPETEPC